MEEVKGDILLDGGIIKHIGAVEPALLAQYSSLTRIDAKGKWISPGLAPNYPLVVRSEAD